MSLRSSTLRRHPPKNLRIPGAVQSHDDAVADQLVVADALDGHQVLETDFLVGRPKREQGKKAERGETKHILQNGISPISNR